MKILIKTKGGHEQGLGDITGSIAVADAATELGITIKIVVEGETAAIDLVRDSGIPWVEVKNTPAFFQILENFKPDAVLINQLNSSIDLVAGIKKAGFLVATLDDTGPAALIADLRFNPEYAIENAYTGHQFIPLKHEYRKANREHRKIEKEVRRILVTLGGSDTYGFTPKVVRALANISDLTSITIIAGPSFRHEIELNQAISDSGRHYILVHNVKDMIPLLRSADLAICSAGLTLFELACVGTPAVVICAELFEEETARYMEKHGFGINLGFGSNVTENTISQSVLDLIADFEKRKTMSESGKKMIDGNGSHRIIETIVQSIERKRFVNRGLDKAI